MPIGSRLSRVAHKYSWKSSLGKPRIKLVGNLMFRIATVDVYGDIRTRVVMSNLDGRRWTNPLAFEFQPNYDQGVTADRYDMFDYDFSVCRIDEGQYSYIYLMIVSGTRPHNDSTSFADANAETFINVVRLHHDKKESGSYDDWIYDGALAFKPQVGGGYSWFSNPAMRVSKRYGNNQTCCIVGTSLVRQASTRDGLLSDGATCKLFTLYIQHMGISRDSRVLGFRMVTNTFTLPCTGTSTLALGPIAWTKQPSDCHMHIGISSANGAIIERLNITGANTNLGNNPNLSGARLSLSRASRDFNPHYADSTIRVNFQSNLVALSEGEDSSPISTYDMDAMPDEYAASPLAAAANGGVLLPGQTVTYRVPFNIPESLASDTPSDGSLSSAVKVRVRFVKPEYLGYQGDAATLAAVNVGDAIEPPVATLSDAQDEEPWFEDPDFEDLTDEEWQEFIYFLMLLAALNDMSDEELLDFEIDVLDGGLEPENMDDLFDAEAVSDDEPSDDPGSGGAEGDGDRDDGGNGSDGGGDGGRGDDASGKGDGSAHRLVDTGDHNIIGKLLFGNGQ